MGLHGPQSNGFQFGGRSSPTTLSEINVTPLVDIMLVLLIVFMISAPLMQQGIHVDLPKANAGAMTEAPDQLVLVIDRTKNILIADHIIQPGTLLHKLSAITQAKPQIEVVIQADKGIPYGFIAGVMAEVKQSGISRIGLVTDPDPSNSRL